MSHVNCSVYGCKSTPKYNKDLKFHRIPRDARRQFWIEACRRPDLLDKNVKQLYNMHVCSLHFGEWMYMKKKLRSAAIPVLNLPSASIHSMSTQTEAPTISIIKDLHSRGVQQHIHVSAAVSTSAQTSQTRKTLTDHTPKTTNSEIEGFQCNQCENQIKGFRYVCVECPDYDLCSTCEARGIHDTHYVLRIPAPRLQCEIQQVLQRIRNEIMQLILQMNDNSEMRQDLLAAYSIKVEKPDIKEEPQIKEEPPEDVDFDPLENAASITPETTETHQSQRRNDNLSYVSKDVKSQAPVTVSRLSSDHLDYECLVLHADPMSASGNISQFLSIVKTDDAVNDITVKMECDDVVEEGNQNIGRKRGKQSVKLKAKRSKVDTKESSSTID